MDQIKLEKVQLPGRLQPTKNNDFYVQWYTWDYDSEDYSKEMQSIEDNIYDTVQFTKTDKPEKYKWVLLWEITRKTRKPVTSKNKKNLSWFFIHELYKDALTTKGYEYPNCGVQRIDWSENLPNEPFKLTSEVIEAFREVIVRKGVSEYMVQPNKIFSLEESFNGFFPLINGIKEIIRSQNK